MLIECLHKIIPCSISYTRILKPVESAWYADEAFVCSVLFVISSQSKRSYKFRVSVRGSETSEVRLGRWVMERRQSAAVTCRSKWGTCWQNERTFMLHIHIYYKYTYIFTTLYISSIISLISKVQFDFIKFIIKFLAIVWIFALKIWYVYITMNSNWIEHMSILTKVYLR